MQIAGRTNKDQINVKLAELKSLECINKIKYNNTIVLNLNQYAKRELLKIEDADKILNQFCNNHKIEKYKLSRVDVCFNFDIPFEDMLPLGVYLVDCWRILYPKGKNAFITQPSEQVNEVGWNCSGCTCIMYNKLEEIAVRGTNTIGSDYNTRIEMQLFPRAEWQARADRCTSLSAIINQYALKKLSKIEGETIEKAIAYRTSAIKRIRREARSLVALVDRTRCQIYAYKIIE